jgi:lipopolysaccharide transport system ATP-binding protein
MINGEISSLLEMGTGFHPELSGRENVFLNGAVLGMGRTEILRKFDEIVAFSEIEKFIDTPYKHYSSGMQARLAFAVAAHLDPDIMILDEVLAVGDMAFQKKCLKKMDVISNSGATIIFVNHGVDAVKQFCNHAIVLDHGQLVLDTDDVDKAIALYLGED